MSIKKNIKNNVRAGNNSRAIMMVIFCTLLTASGQIMMKYSTSHLNSISEIITNVPLIIGLIFYAAASAILIIALKNADLSLLYPFIALSFVWVTGASILLFNEHVSVFNWAGIVAIIIGVSFLGGGGK